MTETVNHTPGPWSYGGSVEQVWGGVIESCGYHVASAHGKNDDECKANAHLIAAAPEMLEALKAAIANSDANIGPYGRTSEAQAVYDQVSDAIDKAEGRS